MIPEANIPPWPVYLTPEQRAALFGFPPGWGVEYTNELWEWYPLPAPRWVRVKADGPASTPPVKRHFWERGR